MSLLIKFKGQKLWKDSLTIALTIFSLIGVCMGIGAFSLESIDRWYIRLLLIFLTFCFIFIMVIILKVIYTKKRITLSIRGINVEIKQGDIFKANGWKLIPFNERYDTKVDDVIISHSSLNGIFIDKYVKDDKNKLVKTITKDTGNLKYITSSGKQISCLGRIIPYNNEYMLLAFTHMNEQNEAHISLSEYENCLRQMWKEISRTYAGRPVCLPLLGGGITRFDDKNEKSEFELLKCIICTLRTSNVHINKPITIFLTENTIKKINIYELKGVC